MLLYQVGVSPRLSPGRTAPSEQRRVLDGQTGLIRKKINADGTDRLNICTMTTGHHSNHRTAKIPEYARERLTAYRTAQNSTTFNNLIGHHEPPYFAGVNTSTKPRRLYSMS